MSTPRSATETFDPETALGYLLYKAHQCALAVFRRRLEPVGLTPQQFGALAFLHRQDGQTQKALGQRGAVDPNTLVGIIDRLEAAGLVQRAPDAKDRRAKVVRLTPAGRATFAKCLPLQRAAARQCWAGLSAAEQDQLRRLLHKLLMSLE